MTSLINESRTTAAAPSTTRQRLNAADCALLAVDRTLREMGCPGFETQMFLSLSSRADAAGLRDAIAHLSRAHPVLTSRLVESEGRGWSYWRFRPEAECPLHEITVASADPDAVHECAGRLLSTPCDPAKTDPIRFYLLHQPDGRDVFLLQYNHTLMDINATVPLIQELNRLTNYGGVGFKPDPQAAIPALAPSSPLTSPDLLRQHLRSFPLSRRKPAMARTLDYWWQLLRGKTGMLGAAKPRSAAPMELRLAARQLVPAQMRALKTNVVKVCGFPSLSMALMASSFRAIDRLSPGRSKPATNFVAGIGVDLGLRSHQPLALQNLVSIVPIVAPLEELGDRDSLMRLLTGQMRQRLAEEFDLGMLQCLSVLSKRPRQARWLLDVVLTMGFSLWYAYFGSVDSVGDHFAGALIDNVFYTGPSWSPMGITLLANQYRDRLFLQATYVPESVSPQLANEFLDAVVEDLLEGNELAD